MKVNLRSTSLAVGMHFVIAMPVVAEVPVSASGDHDALLASSDPKLAQNKKLVYDFWREVFEAGQMDRVEQYMDEGYIQHNPSVPTGRAAFVEFFRKVKAQAR